MAKIEGATLIIHPAKEVAITGCAIRAFQATGQTSLPKVDNAKYEVVTAG